jgi:hypothetical protein
MFLSLSAAPYPLYAIFSVSPIKFLPKIAENAFWHVKIPKSGKN